MHIYERFVVLLCDVLCEIEPSRFVEFGNSVDRLLVQRLPHEVAHARNRAVHILVILVGQVAEFVQPFGHQVERLAALFEQTG